MFRKVVAAGAILALIAALVVLAWPQLFGLQRTFVVAQAVSLRGLTAAIAGLGVITLLLIALLSPVARRFTASVAVVLLAFGVLNLAVLGTRGAGNTAFQTKAPADVTVLSWNTLGDAPGAEAIAALALAKDADIVALPETSPETAEEVRQRMTDGGAPMNLLHLSYDRISKARTTSLLISTALGPYVRDDSAGSTDTLPSVVARPADGDGPVIVAAHPVSPMPGEMDGWRQGLDWLAEQCTGDVILAGDLNSTLDHYAGLGVDGGDLGACHDGARVTGNAAAGTWPTALPGPLGAPIDHVMATDAWEFVGFAVLGSLDGAGSDHRPVLAQLRPSG